ncbi:hypothetical protein GLOTRDRAFT_95038 [Gloeophyllum trabeum ATCC 11539]|uniref:F-box domain-containing protein n=1 Tax=Gloeophyllum trabeum (strain ATCC 11539 / FP-39264 / Madison 617) TaxID=670483 RepID=S7PZB2_GLOTA|nr:uncharacterized protein GLOTRDRAFT_95038 [Gloeophyllum trabeum ATCC 11539]EPQ52976.1 hypothetical protein GLOTRDRAFT_95038 [Gloeophyllum trabeum ATCC 11539]
MPPISASKLPPELRRMVCDAADSREDLYSMALTCTSWSAPALDALWASLHYIRPLLTLATLLGWSEEDDTDSDESESSRSSTPQIDWTRFDSYANRVRTLRYSYFSGGNGNVDVYDVIGDLFRARQRPLLPLLREFRWEHVHSSSTLDVRLPGVLEAFTTGSLQAVSVSTSLMAEYEDIPRISDRILASRDIALGNWFATLPRRCPGLVNFSLGGYVPVFSLDFIREFQSLVVLDLGDLHMYNTGWVKARRLRSFAQLTQLKTFAVIAYIERPQDIAGAWSAFPILETLRTENTMPAVANEIVRRISSNRLKNFFYNLTEDPLDLYDVQLLFGSLARFSSSLTTLRIDIESISDPESPDGARFSEVISPLLVLPNIQELRISPFYQNPDDLPPYMAVDEDLERMARAWPALAELQLNVRVADGGVTFQSLVTLATCSPHLKSLYLYSMNVPETLNLRTAPQTSHRLEVLHLRSPTYRDAEEFAGALWRLFPGLQTEKMRDKFPSDVLESLEELAIGSRIGC